MKLGVVIVTYNRLDLLKECIESCLNQTYPFEKIIIINNNSSDGTKEYLASIKDAKVLIHNLKENVGGSGGFYEGVKESQKYNLDYVLLIDDDAILNFDYCEHIYKYMINEPKGIVGYSGTVKTNNIIQYEHRRFLKKHFHEINSTKDNYIGKYFDLELATFCGLFISTKIIKKIGLPKKDFFIWYDDTEYCMRMNKYGKIRNVNDSVLNHKTKIANIKGFNWKSYYGLRNKIYIIKKYFSKFQLLKFTLSMILRIIGGKILAVLKHDIYYLKVSNIYKDALNDGMKNKYGKNEKYMPGYKLVKGSGK